MKGAIDNSDFRIGEWTVQPQRGCVRRGRAEIRLKPRAMAVLNRLAAARGEVVTRNELFDAVWRGAVVSDDALTQCVVELRKAFADSARDARVIETLPRVGFRLVPTVKKLDPSAPPRRRRGIFGLLAATGIALTMATAFALALIDRQSLPPAAEDRSLTTNEGS